MHKDKLYVRHGRRLVPLDSPRVAQDSPEIDLAALWRGGWTPDLSAQSRIDTMPLGIGANKQPSGGGTLPPSSAPSPPRRQVAAATKPERVTEPEVFNSPPARAGAMR